MLEKDKVHRNSSNEATYVTYNYISISINTELLPVGKQTPLLISPVLKSLVTLSKNCVLKCLETCY